MQTKLTSSPQHLLIFSPSGLQITAIQTQITTQHRENLPLAVQLRHQSPRKMKCKKTFRLSHRCHQQCESSHRETRQRLFSPRPPETCLAIEGRVIMIKEGKCTVQIRSTKSRSASSPQPRLLATLNTLISSSGTQAGLKITKRSLIRFAKYSSTPIGIPSSLTRQARKAQGVIVIGHTALFSGNSRANQKLSDARANYVRTHFINQKVRPAVILFDGVAAQQPIRKTLTEKDQRINRRVEVYLLS